MATPVAPRKITIGPRENDYLYTEVAPDLWKCKKPAIKSDVPDGYVLWLVKHEGIWMAVHAPGTCTTIAEAIGGNRIVFGSWEADVTASGPHKWDIWDTNGWRGVEDWFFETRVVEPEG